jgi:CRP-like cAMP-binding protein
MAMPEIVVPGSLIGELAMLVEHDYASTIVARGRVFCLKLIRTEMHAQMREDAALTEHFRDRMTERLLQTAEELRRIDDALAARSPATLQPSPEKFVAATGWYR